MRARTLWPVLAALLGAAGCVTGTTLQPLSTTATNPTGEAVAEANGVRLVANGDAWRGNPSNLENIVTPVRVRLENQSGRPLRIENKDFVLVGASHFQYAALSPFQLREEGLSAVGGSGYRSSAAVSFGVGVGYGAGPWRHGPFSHGHVWAGAPWGWGPGWGPGWYDPFWGPGWYDPFYGPYAYRPPEPLPTRDMVRKALPEGTLDTGGTLTGFLYFQNVGDREGQVTLQAHLVDARTGEEFGTLSIPFGVRS